MVKKSFRMLTGLLIIAMLAAGCSSGNNDAKQPTEGTGSNGTTKISVFAHQGTDQDLSTNQFTKALEDKFNIQLNWTTVPFDGAAEKRQISLASGDYPDMYLLIPWVDRFSQTDLLKFGQQGVILPLNDLIDQHAPNIKKALDSNDYYKAMNTAPDGNIYGLTQLNECYHCSYQNKLWLNTTWLKKLGLSEPTTTEEFKEVLKAFKTQDPNANGKADEVPLSGSIETWGTHIVPFLMNGFIYNDDKSYLMLNDGKVDLAANKPEWKEGLSYIKSLYDEGLIDEGAFTQNAEALKKIGNNAGTQLLGAAAAGHPAIFVDTGADAPQGKDFNPIAPLSGPHASNATFNFPVDPGATFVLTNKASEEVKVAAIQMLDYIYTEEGQLLGNYGEENVDWRRPKDGDVPINENAAPVFATIPGKPGDPSRNSAWGSLAQYNHNRAFRDGWIQGTEIYTGEGYERRLQEATTLYDGKEPEEVFPLWAIWTDPAAADEMGMMQTNIKDYIDQSTLQFITGGKSLDKDWEDYVAGLEGLNLQGYLDQLQKAYDASSLKK
ncbi:extracellular solute-binding protein [Paenibacillus lemnae]|uniref:Extracellular solute-binding protein n=1 Tax=Paenibacillus lemnae TaxID=1330551 RepID=A0A848MBI1_PAELE|nr:extracellular solute-binding protein [Paenibacillus lemnae]NMO97599.1 extracellular solute-binding protein [Paenibacillus lemnae]